MRKFVLGVFIICLAPLWGQETVSDRIARLIDALPEGSEAGIAVYDLTEGKPLYAYRADKLSRPASTLKLLTSVTALSVTDVEVPFHTDVWYSGEVRNDTLYGDIHVVGGFDPEFGDSDMDSLVSAVCRLPFRVVSGGMKGDVSLKDSLYWGNGWAWDDTPAAYQPYLSTLMFEKGTVRVSVYPSEVGQPARVQTFPQSTYYSVNNHTCSHRPDIGPLRVSRDWLHNGNEIVLTGNVSRVSARELNLYGSPDYFMHTLTERLEDRGFRFSSSYQFAEFTQQDSAVQVCSHPCPLQRVLDRTLKESDNLGAEALLWRIGYMTTGRKYVTAEDGLEQVRKMIRALGHNPALYKVADGCGLSDYNYLSPALLVDLLAYAYRNTEVFRQLYKALPIAGIDGTLKHRMGSGKAFRRVHAKTGSFTAINSLAGYLKNDSGHWIAFAIMNQNILSAARARQFQDAVCEILCGL